MNPRAKGGSEMIIHPDIIMTNAEESGDTPVVTKALPKGYGRIVRDAEGNVVDIELGDSVDGDEEIDEDENALDLETRQLQPSFTTSEREKWARRRAGNQQDTGLIQGTWREANRLEDLPMFCY
jgi:nucleolar protein 16